MPTVRDRLIAPFALAAFAGLLILVGAHHEPWFDEAQAWLIARGNTPWTLVTRGVRYEGTPALWHGLLWLVQHLGLPYGGLWLVSSALAFAGAWLVLYKSPFPIWIRIGLIFSYFFAYQYSVVARSYAIDLALLPLLAFLFASRCERPLLYAALLGLLANTNAHSFMLSGVLALELTWSLRTRLLVLDIRSWAAISLYGALSLAAIAQAWPPANINFIVPKRGDSPLAPVWNTLVLVTEAFVERGDVFSLQAPTWPWRVVGVGLTVAILAPAALLWAQARRLLLALCLFGALIGFSILKYGNYWHAGILFLTFVFCLWISWDHSAQLRRWARRWLAGALAALLAFQIWCAGAAGVREILTPYSAARATARSLIEHRRRHPGESIAVAGFKGFAVAPWFDQNPFANYEGGAPSPAYYLWRRSEAPIPGLDEASWKRTADGGYDRLLLSTFNVMGWNGPARYIADARHAGYCPTSLFRGAMIWKTYALETDDMMIFDRCAVPPFPDRPNSL
jgi:hypothetical protein